MKTLQANGITIRYDIQGNGPWITFAHSLGCDLSMWDDQTAALAGAFTVLRYDVRGHGGSSAPPGPYNFPQMTGDALGLLDALGVARTHFVGLSMGGMIGQHLALTAPDRLERLVLCSTSSGYDNPESVARLWEQRAALVEADGMQTVVGSTLERWFTAPFLSERKDTTTRIGQLIATTPTAGYAAWGRMVSTHSTAARLGEIGVPTLVVVGEEDPGTTPAVARVIADGIPDARLEVIPRASHLLNIEQAESFNKLLRTFLN